MAVTQDELCAGVKLALREMEGRVWALGPVVDPRMWATPADDRVGPETKSFCVDLETACTWIDAVERVTHDTATAVQSLRRMWYCARYPGGAKFDRAIKTDSSRLLRAGTVGQAVLDGLARSGLLRLNPASSDRDVDLSHVFVALDYAVNGDGHDASLLKLIVSADSSVQGMLSWLGDLASVWIGLQTLRQRWMAKHSGQTPTRGTVSEPDTEAFWLEQSFVDRSPTSDLLGDFDGVILAAELAKDPGQPVASLLYRYYTALAAAPGPDDVNVANRLSLFLRRSDPAVPATIVGGQVTVTTDTGPALRKMVDVSSRILLGAARVAKSNWWGALQAAEEVGSDWGQWAVGEIGDRFARFIEAMAADGATVTVWPAQQPAPVNLGYAATVRGRAAALLTPADPAQTPVDLLEAIAQYYLTSNDPWGSPPPRGSQLSPVWLGDFTGKSARPGGPATVVIDDVFPWSQIWPSAGGAPHRDLITLDGATTPGRKVFRIVTVNPDTRTLTVDTDPGLGNSPSTWTIIRRPRLVLIDPFGSRPHLAGTAATGAPGQSAATVRIDTDAGTVAALGGVNLGIDTILLDDDEGVPRLPFRVLAADISNPAQPVLTLDRPPVLSAPSRWQVPAGIGGAGSDVTVPTNPGTGCDHYDGLIFLIYGGVVQQVQPWTSFTSFAFPPRSLRGNRRYDARAFRSTQGIGAQFRNHCFMVHEVTQRSRSLTADGADSVVGRDYYAGVVTLPHAAVTVSPADGSEQEIRLHNGNVDHAVTTGSKGCLVSPQYYVLRAALVATYISELRLLSEAPDDALAEVQAAQTKDAAEGIYNDVPNAKWDDKVVAELFVIRPDERSPQPFVPLTRWLDL